MPNNLFIRIWDVQHGSAAYVRTPQNRHMAIDLGVGDLSGNLVGSSSYRENFSPLAYLRQNWKVSQLDAVIITHPHTDHVDDIFEFDNLSPRMLITPRHITDAEVKSGNPSKDNNVLSKFLTTRQHYNHPLTTPSVYDEQPDLEFKTFSPSGCAVSNLNNQSIVVFLTYAGSTVCIPGDNESAAWRELLLNPSFVSCLKKTDILVASHHGRESGFCSDIFERCHPKLVIISDGPQGNTCVADKYYNQASGWTVHKPGKESKTRYVLTTRKDGSVDISIGFESDNTRYMSVTTE